MKKKLREVIEYLDYDELQKMKKDLTLGGVHLFRLVDEQIQRESLEHEYYCSICNAKIDQESTNNFTLLFGPEGIKRKATFCAIDCMEYFLNNLKDLKKEMEKESI
ncbi:hypothetical protein HYU19_04410 [Candidatus Woesearchaeota archaeon]|nr:hypothetical protein [Candidatus Woesearchaeota archaeon]